mgnify:CR=1 FL=1
MTKEVLIKHLWIIVGMLLGNLTKEKLEELDLTCWAEEVESIIKREV